MSLPKEKRPALHATGATDVVAHDEPAGQLAQDVTLPKEYRPALQAMGATDVVAHDEPAGQLTHDVAFPKEKRPAGHCLPNTVAGENADAK